MPSGSSGKIEPAAAQEALARELSESWHRAELGRG